MKFLAPLTLMLLTLPSIANAQQSGYVGMHHLKPKPAPVEPAPVVEDKPEPEDTKPTYAPLSLKEALVKPEDLERWDHMSEAALANSPLQIQKLVHLIEADRGTVPPQGLFLAAKSLADNDLMEQAAVYYFVGQLRLNFDMERWPSTQNKEDVKRIAEQSKKSPDQVAPNSDSTPRIQNPHQGMNSLGDQIGAPIISWVIKDPARMDKMIKQVKEWDISSPYEYDPGYELSEPVPFEKWGKLLEKTRDDYFMQMIQWAKLMSKVRR